MDSKHKIHGRAICELSITHFFSVKLVLKECFYFLPVKIVVRPFLKCGAPDQHKKQAQKTILKRVEGKAKMKFFLNQPGTEIEGER